VGVHEWHGDSVEDVNVAENTNQLRAADLITAIKSAGIRFIVALPDRTTSEHLLGRVDEFTI
jgi:hypothetical protein